MAKFSSIEEVPEDIRQRLEEFVTNVGGDTFAIHGLPPELTGALMARYSRAQTGLQLTLVNEFLDEQGNPSQLRGTEVINRVLNSFGDDSVGELEGIAMGIEEISQLATKGLEDRRIGGSPIEQSTRYVVYDKKDKDGKWRYLRPKEVKEAGLLDIFQEVNDRAFEVYSEGVRLLQPLFQNQFPKEKFKIEVERNGQKIKVGHGELQGEAEEKAFRLGYAFTIRCAALDVGRCVLPSSTLTHIGINGNGRYWTGVLNHLKSSNIIEENERAVKLEAELNKVVPTYIKRNKRSEYLVDVRERMQVLADELFDHKMPQANKVTLLKRSDYQDEVLASSVFPYTNLSLPQIMEVITTLPASEKDRIMSEYLGNRKSRRDRSGRGLEAGYPLTFDLVGGFAEYRDLERHRMLTQQRQTLTTDLGFILPPEMVEVGLERQVNEVVASMENLNAEMKRAGLKDSSQYATLFNHRLRWMMGMNLRAFQHMSELRSEVAGHFSYRAMVQEMAKEVTKACPWAQPAYGFVNYSDPDNKISRANEQSRIAGKNLAKGIDSGLDLE